MLIDLEQEVDRGQPSFADHAPPVNDHAGGTAYADEAVHWDALNARFDAERISHSFALSDDDACTN